jgi:hydrogenase-1 operon protein HyaF
MNAPAVLAEIRERAASWRGGENHVLNFTLFPMTDADHALLINTLERADLEMTSGGFGDCRIMATRYRHVWAVQYVNAMGHTILDTVEIGALPPAARASWQDFEDSGERLAEVLEAYLP